MKVENYTKCPVCETPINERQYIETYVSPFNNQEYKLYECSNCEIQWWEPLKMIPEFYEDEGLEGYATMYDINAALTSKHFAINIFFEFLEKIALKRDTVRILDVGCGNGVFLKNLKDIWSRKDIKLEIVGIDLDKKSINVAKQILPVAKFKVASLEEFEKENDIGKFDIITFFEVLEHQDNPRGFLSTIYKLTKDDGFIFGSVPNRERFLVSFDRKYYSRDSDFPPNHFLHFNKKSLTFLLSEMGFTNIRFYNHDFELQDIGHYVAMCLSFGILDKLKKNIKNNIQNNSKNTSVLGLKNLIYQLLGITFYKFYYKNPWHLVFSARKKEKIL